MCFHLSDCGEGDEIQGQLSCSTWRPGGPGGAVAQVPGDRDNVVSTVNTVYNKQSAVYKRTSRFWNLISTKDMFCNFYDLKHGWPGEITKMFT